VRVLILQEAVIHEKDIVAQLAVIKKHGLSGWDVTSSQQLDPAIRGALHNGIVVSAGNNRPKR